MQFFQMTPIRLIWITTIALFLLVACTYLLRPIIDPDFFWHLKTGEWIWQNGRLPTYDPFTFTGPQTPNRQQLFILQGYPLAQLVYYALHRICGWPGIFLLRFLLAAAFWLLFMTRFSLSGLTRHSWLLAGGLLMLFCVLCLQPYDMDRPHFFSFLYFGVLLLLYEWVVNRGYRRKPASVILPSIALTTIWGNTHGLSILALVILAVIASVETILFALKRRDKKRYFAVAGFVSGGIAGCFLNNTRLNLPEIVGKLSAKASKIALYNKEYFSTWDNFQATSDLNILFFWGFVLVVAIVAACSWSVDYLAEILILIGLGVYACLSVRYIPFFVIAAIPFLYTQITRLNRLTPLKYVVAVGGAILFTFSVANEVDNISQLKKIGALSNDFPVAATDFIIASNLDGRIFNSYAWGGYLLWRLAPQRKIYQDSRALDEQVSKDWLAASINMRGNSGPIWREIFDKYDIRVAILPKFSEEQRGQPHRLSLAISRDPQWKMVYHDSLAIVFQRVN